ncbi:hypothetical protein M885DRAFT_514602 [Pelagophyceae sp. CCMP2097]|nr:hypothetical protein M885DRAFT_514602 [Pelagophyceae sp. CCMP2097]
MRTARRWLARGGSGYAALALAAWAVLCDGFVTRPRGGARAVAGVDARQRRRHALSARKEDVNVIGLVTLSKADARRRARSLYDAARLKLRRGDTAKAVEMLEAAVAADARDAHSWLCLASALRSELRLAEERRCFDRALSACPRSVHLLHAAGVSAAAGGDVPRARKFFGRALRVDATSAHARHSWAALELECGRVSEARRILGDAGDRDTPQIHVARAEVDALRAPQACAAAAAALDAVATLYEARAEPISAAHVLRAAAKLDGGDARRALSRSRRALELDGGSAASRVAVAALLRAAGDARAARETLRGALTAADTGRKDDHVAHRALAILELDHFGDADAAALVLDGALARWPRQASLFTLAGSAAQARGRTDTARKHFAAAARLSTAAERAPALTAWGTFEAECGDRGAAEKLFDRVVACDALHGATYAARADYESRRWGDYTAARATIKKGLRAVLRGSPPLRRRWAPTLWHGWAMVEARAAAAGDAAAKAAGAAPAPRRAAPVPAPAVGRDELSARLQRRLLRAGLRAANVSVPLGRELNDLVLLRHSLGALEFRRGRFAAAFDAFLGGDARVYGGSAALLLGAARARLVLDARVCDDDDIADGALVSQDCSAALRGATRPSSARNTALTARHLFARAAAVDPHDASIWRSWAVAEARHAALRHRGVGPDARAVFAEALSRHATDTQLVVAFAEALIRAKEPPLAKQVLLKGAWSCARGCARLEKLVEVAASTSLWGDGLSERDAPALLRRAAIRMPPPACTAANPEKRKAQPQNQRGSAKACAALLARLSRLELRQLRCAPRAERFAQAAVAAHARCAAAHVALGSCHEAASRHRLAEAAFSAACRYDRYEDASAAATGYAAVALAALQVRRRAYNAARHTLEDALLVASTHAPLWHALAELEAKLGNIDGLAQLHRRAKAAGEHFRTPSPFFATDDSHHDD